MIVEQAWTIAVADLGEKPPEMERRLLAGGRREGLSGDFSPSDYLPGQPPRPKPKVILEVLIPGEPRGQARHRSTPLMHGGRPVLGRGGRPVVIAYDDPKSRGWKGAAQSRMLAALGSAGLAAPFVAAGPVRLTLHAVFTCPRSSWRKRNPLPRRRHTGKPDVDNVLKIAKDAAKGVLWLDDCQVAEVLAEKWVGAQEEAPFLLLRVERIAE